MDIKTLANNPDAYAPALHSRDREADTADEAQDLEFPQFSGHWV